MTDKTYSDRARFSEVILAASPIKTAVDVCIQTNSQCSSLTNNTEQWSSSLLVKSIDVELETEDLTDDNVDNPTPVAKGDITIKVTSSKQFNDIEYTYILTAKQTAQGTANWSTSGTCQTASLC